MKRSKRFDIEIKNQNETGQPEDPFKNLNRKQKRQLLQKKRAPEFTKKYCTKNRKTKEEKKRHQLNMMKKGLQEKGLWDHYRWIIDPKCRAEMKEYMEQQRKYLQSIKIKKEESSELEQK